MGVSLSYRTTEPVAASAKKAILADAERLNRERAWWCESIIFFEAAGRKKKGPTPLTGDTKLFRADETDDDDDEFMGYRDAAFIAQQLVRWSFEYGVNWTLEMVGTEVGTITNGEVQPPGLFQWDRPENAVDRRRAARIDRKYASRNG
jgi:hypothetical protein